MNDVHPPYLKGRRAINDSNIIAAMWSLYFHSKCLRNEVHNRGRSALPRQIIGHVPRRKWRETRRKEIDDALPSGMIIVWFLAWPLCSKGILFVIPWLAIIVHGWMKERNQVLRIFIEVMCETMLALLLGWLSHKLQSLNFAVIHLPHTTLRRAQARFCDAYLWELARQPIIGMYVGST